MKKQVQVLFMTLALVLVLGNNLSAQVLQKLSGIAVSIDVGKQKLEVLFEHPVTGEEVLKIFQILPNTNFKNAKRLSDIEPQDPVSIDYHENRGSHLEAVYIEVIPLEGVPFSKEGLKKKIPFL